MVEGHLRNVIGDAKTGSREVVVEFDGLITQAGASDFMASLRHAPRGPAVKMLAGEARMEQDGSVSQVAVPGLVSFVRLRGDGSVRAGTQMEWLVEDFSHRRQIMDSGMKTPDETDKGVCICRKSWVCIDYWGFALSEKLTSSAFKSVSKPTVALMYLRMTLCPISRSPEISSSIASVNRARRKEASLCARLRTVLRKSIVSGMVISSVPARSIALEVSFR